MQPPVDPTAANYEEVPARSGLGGNLFAALYVVFGAVSIGLAVDEEFARGKAEFSGDSWRVVLALLGAMSAFLALRGFVRALQDRRWRLTPELHERMALRGKLLLILGIALFAVAVVPAVGDATIEFSGWATAFYVAASVFFVVQGLVFQWNPTRFFRQQRVAKGQGRPGVARIIRASDTGMSVNDAPQVKIEFELEVGGKTHLVSDKIVMQRARLALLVPGSTVNVLVDQVDPNVFHVDWDSWRGPASS